ncbi:SH3 domain-containing protein [Tetragenococcus halophilus]|uniref:N-acetylmuramoyl-L-alanine amidase n=1 Tax=Tetragenococcus halophilus (strain DSM 20338 / JCM 20259 / NCIMB 9735 / NBRC 12172) TaxID=945021 RepID=A0AAN1VRI4_TETHN|nr:SH3 domain-containing protein [Tetragenococcus halophilus]BAK95119.1 putative N-acetylmuramoyl-L-alanine amidase [Tetragenococcus halophilus NBRC 12172]GBD71137.1 putative N-acetylmuramoyl-L-alanine amidase [Tetragenococcus halophilus subsp. halophilus]
MKKVKTLLMTAIVVVMTFAPIASAGAYSIDTTYNQMRSTQRTTNNYIILHETGGVAPAINNAQYFNREWRNAGTYSSHVVGDGGDVYQISPEGYVQWGAGSYANARSPVQIELARTNDKATFEKDYKAYVNLARDMAKKYNIPLTLDGAGRGIKSHLWVTENIWGNHQDPYGYLAQHGISKADLAQDLRTGLDSSDDVDADPETNNPGSTAPDPDNDDYQNASGSYTFSNTTKIRNSVGTNGGYTGINYSAGQTVNYDRVYKNVDGYNWLSYVSYGGQRRYVAMTNSSQSNNNQNYENTSGTYRFNNTTRIRNGLGTSASYSGRNYTAGQSVVYDRVYRNVDGYDWLSYMSYSGQRRYVAMTNSGSSQSANTQQNQSGAYTFRNTTRIRNGVGVNAGYTGRNYNAGQTVYYDRVYRNVNGYDWLSYMSYSGQRHYVAMTN